MSNPGRVLAIWLNHSYAHTSKHLNFLPSSLKGADMSLYETACGLGLKCVLVPIISLESYYHRDETRHVFQGRFYGFNQGQSADGASLGDEYECWGSDMPESKVTWLNDYPKRKDESEEEKKKRQQKGLKEVQLAYMAVSRTHRPLHNRS